jgi:thioredoxin 1
MTPRIRRLSILYKNKIAFGKINTSKNQEISKQYKIMSIPQIIFFKNGSKKFSITGLKSIGQIKKKIDDFLKK